MEQIFTTILCPIFVPASVEVEVKLLRAAGKRLLADCLGMNSAPPGRTWNDSDMAGKWDGIIMESPCHWIGFLGKILTGNHGFYHGFYHQI
jgi:hypothetical protein